MPIFPGGNDSCWQLVRFAEGRQAAATLLMILAMGNSLKRG